MIHLKLLLEAALSRKAPYIKNTYGADLHKIKKSINQIEQELSKILGKKVYINNDVNWKDGAYAFFTTNRNQSPTNMIYWESVTTGYYEIRKTLTRGDYHAYGVSSDGKYDEKYVYSFDKEWAYYREKLGNAVKYYVVKQSGKPLFHNKNLMYKQNSGDTWAELRPGTKAYNAIKTKVFGD